MRRNVHRIAVPLILAVIAAPAAAVEPRRADSQPTAIELSSKFPAFSGRVASKAAPCMKGRPVELLRKASDGDAKLLGKDTSDSSGSWAVRLDNVKAGAYYARTKRKVKGKGSARTICEPGRSEVVVID